MRKLKSKPMFRGKATGISVRWQGGQFCLIVADQGFVGCGIFSLEVLEEFNMAGALAKGTPQKPLIEPEDLLPSKIVAVSSRARKLGVRKGMTGEEALKRFLGA